MSFRESSSKGGNKTKDGNGGNNEFPPEAIDFDELYFYARNCPEFNDYIANNIKVAKILIADELALAKRKALQNGQNVILFPLTAVITNARWNRLKKSTLWRPEFEALEPMIVGQKDIDVVGLFTKMERILRRTLTSNPKGKLKTTNKPVILNWVFDLVQDMTDSSLIRETMMNHWQQLRQTTLFTDCEEDLVFELTDDPFVNEMISFFNGRRWLRCALEDMYLECKKAFQSHACLKAV